MHVLKSEIMRRLQIWTPWRSSCSSKADISFRTVVIRSQNVMTIVHKRQSSASYVEKLKLLLKLLLMFPIQCSACVQFKSKDVIFTHIHIKFIVSQISSSRLKFQAFKSLFVLVQLAWAYKLQSKRKGQNIGWPYIRMGTPDDHLLSSSSLDF